MEFHHLKAFVMVGETKSFSKAAELLYLTQPTVSAHIMSLEKELKVKLFDRRGRDIELTPVGRRLYLQAQKLLRVKEDMLMDLKRYQGSVEGELLVYSSSIPAVYILPGITKQLNGYYPKLKLRVIQTDSGEVIRSIFERHIEIGITGMQKADGDLEYLPFSEDKLVVITPPDFRPKGPAEDSIDLKELQREKFIIRESSSGTRANMERMLQKAGLEVDSLNVVAELGSTEAIIQAVKLGLGVSIVSDRAVTDYLKNHMIKVFNIKGLQSKRHFYLVWRKAVTLSPNAEAFKNLLLNPK